MSLLDQKLGLFWNHPSTHVHIMRQSYQVLTTNYKAEICLSKIIEQVASIYGCHNFICIIYFIVFHVLIGLESSPQFLIHLGLKNIPQLFRTYWQHKSMVVHFYSVTMTFLSHDKVMHDISLSVSFILWFSMF